ncbi:MAG TPA: HAD-IIA family hydrolase [Solirubrobacteraceae bacterium]|nr:HAD-IIA family hydrolase [Solirubrobacteraceae bacterium]
MPITPLVASYDVFLIDFDGCVWVGDDLTPRAADALAELRAAGKALAFVTNDGRHNEEAFVRKLWRLGAQASLREIVTVGGALQHVLNEEHHGASAYVIGAQAVHDHVEDAGLRIVNGSDFASRAEVVVAAGHEGLVFDELKVATQALLRGAAFLGAGRDATYPTAGGTFPGTGALLGFLEAATGRTARTVGKPEAQIFHTALDRLEATGDGVRTLVIGDRLDADLAGAHAAGLDGAVVLTGATSPAEARAAAEPAPVAVADSLAELVLGSS